MICFTKSAVLLAIFSTVLAMEMESEGDEEYTKPEITHGASKSFHWLATLFLLLILPSISTTLAVAKKVHTAVLLQFVSLGYAAIEAIFLRFPDADGVENRTSRGTAWFLLLLNIATVVFGSINSGTDFLVNREGKSSLTWIAKLGERTVSVIHITLSVLLTLTGWVKTCLAPVALFGFCRDVHTGQCLAHGIMGSAFIGYGFIYAMVLVLPHFRESKHKRSQEFYDSLVMTAWGIVNTFTEHRWGTQGWSMSDYQHTSMGIIWWAGGLLGLYLSRGGRRSWIPAVLLIFTGWSMSQHSQHLAISTKIHFFFGVVLMTGGALRIAEISFLLHDDRAIPGKIYSFQYLPSFCLIESGVMFMGANEEQLILVLRLGSEHGAYTLTITSAAFLIFLWLLLLLELYQKLTNGSRIDLHNYAAVSENNTGRETPSTEFELEDLEA